VVTGDSSEPLTARLLVLKAGGKPKWPCYHRGHEPARASSIGRNSPQLGRISPSDIELDGD
jgi:hypothetical protein